MEVNEIITRVMSKMNMQTFAPRSSHMVEVTHINDPKSFYVRLASLSDYLISLESRGNPITEEEINIGKRVIYKSKLLEKYVRGVIEFIYLKENSASCLIFAVDYGCREEQSTDIYLPALDIDCPPLALHCELFLCEPKGEVFDKDALDAMKFFVGTHTAKVTIVRNTIDKFTVELKTVECPDDVAMMLALLHYTTMTQSMPCHVNRFLESSVIRPQVIQYKFKDVKVGERLHVRVQSGDSIKGFYVAEVNDFQKYKSTGCEFLQYCKNRPLEDVVAAEADGRCCGVYNQSAIRYERAFVKKIIEPDAKALVKLVDWGKEVEAKFGHIRSVTSTVFNSTPAIAIYCSSTESQVWKTSLPKFLYPGYEFIIEIVEIGNGIDVPHKVNLHKL